MRDGIPERTVKNKAEAQALAEFLAGELWRHIEDCYAIVADLERLEEKWKARPRTNKDGKREFVKP